MSLFFSEEHISKMCYEENEEKENESPASDDENDMPIGNAIAEWATKYQISIVALSSLLLILRLYKLNVPKDPRTLLKTPSNYSVEHVAGGDYFYYGIKKGILSLLKQFSDSFPLAPILNLRINVDGLLLFKSSKLQLWPILGLIKELKQLGPFVIALFSAAKKPSLQEICPNS